jgi:hypothetical protein
VDAGVGTAGTGYVNGAAFDFRDDGFEGALDGGEAGLNLPAVEIGTVIRELKPDAAHYPPSFKRAGSPA